MGQLLRGELNNLFDKSALTHLVSRIGVGPIGSCFFDLFLSSFTGDLKIIWLFILSSKGERVGKFDQRVFIGVHFLGVPDFLDSRIFSKFFQKKGLF